MISRVVTVAVLTVAAAVSAGTAVLGTMPAAVSAAPVSARPSPVVTLAGGGQVVSVDALSPTDAWAAGEQCVSNCAHPSTPVLHLLMLHWNGTRWAQIPVPGESLRDDYFVTSVAATSADDAWVTGSWDGVSSGGAGWFLLHWSGTGWTRTSPPAGGLQQLAAVSAHDAWCPWP